MKKNNFKTGFTLMELLVVVAIIGVIASIVLVALNDVRTKGSDAGVKSNLQTARSQAEVFYNVNTVAPYTYTSVCSVNIIGGAQGAGVAVLAAAKATGLSSVGNNVGGVATLATCNDSANAWAAEVPLKDGGANAMWCVDSIGKSGKVIGTSFVNGTDYTCN